VILFLDFDGQFLGPVELCYDCSYDKALVLHALQVSPLWGALEPRASWLNVDTETGVDDAQAAMAAHFAESEAVHGLQQHHALVDARALRLGVLAIEGGSR
jgi:hypothetical protein